MSQSGSLSTGGGGGGTPIETINMDVGSIAGTTVTIYADNAANQCGASVLFEATSATIGQLKVTDVDDNTFIGLSCGNLGGEGGTDCTGLGSFALASVAGDVAHVAVGASALENSFGTTGNTAIGAASLGTLTSGSNNTAIGFLSGEILDSGDFNNLLGAYSGSNYAGSESSNIMISNLGVTGESNVMRLGTTGVSNNEVSSTYIAGVNGIVTSNPLLMAINSATEQVGTASISIVRQEFFVSGTYTPTPGMFLAFVEVTGGGAAGGGVVAVNGLATTGGGGGGGGYYSIWLKEADIGPSQTVTIGAAGVPVLADFGGNGGDTSFGAFATGNGGAGGSPDLIGSSFNRGGAGGIFSGATGGFGEIGETGADSGPNNSSSIAAYVFSGYGGGGAYTQSTLFLAWCTGQPVYASGGFDANVRGQGGSGAINANFLAGGDQSGGNGFPGVCLVTEYVLS